MLLGNTLHSCVTATANLNSLLEYLSFNRILWLETQRLGSCFEMGFHSISLFCEIERRAEENVEFFLCLNKKCTKKPLKVPTEEKCDILVSSDVQNFEQEFIKTVSVMFLQTFFY